MNRVLLITGSENTAAVLSAQVAELVEGKAEVRSLWIDGTDRGRLQEALREAEREGAVLLLSSAIVRSELITQGVLDPQHSCIVGSRTIDPDRLDAIVELAPGTRALFVNDRAETAEDCINSLRSLGLADIDLQPWYPGQPAPDAACRIALVADVNYLADEKDFSSAIAKLRREKPDHIVIMDQGLVPTIINQIAQAGWTDVRITTLGPGTSEQILNLSKKNAEGLLLTTPFFIDDNNKAAKAWADRFAQIAGFFPTVHPACAYDTVYLIAAAIRNSGEKVTRESIRENLQNLKGFVGLTGPIQFNPAGDIFRKYLIVAVENGKFVRKTDYDYAK